MPVSNPTSTIADCVSCSALSEDRQGTSTAADKREKATNISVGSFLFMPATPYSPGTFACSAPLSPICGKTSVVGNRPQKSLSHLSHLLLLRQVENAKAHL